MSTRSWFSRNLLPWYREHHRPLPWRGTRDPYRIWLSEVILQQTRVDQGLAYYERFVARYPTVAALAAAPAPEVMKLWQGLGYYSRARNLHAAAKQVADGPTGRFPRTAAELHHLKGVGAYTAAAIASIAYDEQVAVVDGNVYRVLARVFGIATPIDTTAGRKQFATLANELVPATDPGDHNQAVMELGATVCTPRNPACDRCPVVTRCIARKEGRISELPVKAGRTKVRDRHFHYLVVSGPRGIVLRQRSGKDIWRDLYEPLLVELEGPATRKTVAAAASELLGRPVVLGKHTPPVKHMLSHQVIHAIFWSIEGPVPRKLPDDCLWVDHDGLRDHAVPRLIERFLEEHFDQR